MLAHPKNHLDLQGYKDRLLKNQRFQSDSCLIVGNGPSASEPIPKEIIECSIIMRCNWFFLEDGLPYGNTIDYYFQSVYNKELYLQLQSYAMKSKYDIKRYCSPFQLGGEEKGLFLFPTADHWAVLSLEHNS